MKKLTKNEMKQLVGGNFPAGGRCATSVPEGCTINTDPKYSIYCKGELLVICPIG